jgi:flavodoxin
MIVLTGITSMDKSDTLNPGKILVVYFSRTGNTREMARLIQKTTGADLFEIMPAKPYPEAYQEVVDQAKEEINAGFHPELKSSIPSLDEYDVIFVGSPNWWSTIAPPVATFLASHDLSGKTVMPFMTHEGTQMGHSVGDIKKLCPDAVVLDGLPIRGQQINGAQKEVAQWLRKIGIKDTNS